MSPSLSTIRRPGLMGLPRFTGTVLLLLDAWPMRRAPLPAPLGGAIFFAGRRADARHAWEEALRLDPDLPTLRERGQNLPP